MAESVCQLDHDDNVMNPVCKKDDGEGTTCPGYELEDGDKIPHPSDRIITRGILHED
jgi:hypothetical protein